MYSVVWTSSNTLGDINTDMISKSWDLVDRQQNGEHAWHRIVFNDNIILRLMMIFLNPAYMWTYQWYEQSTAKDRCVLVRLD